MKITWNARTIEGFEKLKAEVVRNAELCLPDLLGSCIIESDTSDYALGGILKQKQPDARDMPVAFFSRKLQGSRQGNKFLGQMGSTVREKQTYALVCCLLKFQSWIGFNEVVVRSNHKSIVQWYIEDLCTISVPFGRRGRRHEFLSRFNLLIEYIPGDDNADGDTLSRWAYPAGAAQDTNFHGSDEDALRWTEVERQGKIEQEKVLRKKYLHAFGACTARTDIDGVVSMVTLGDHEEQVGTLRACYQQAGQQSPAATRVHFVMPDAMVTNNVPELVASIHEDLPVHSSVEVPVTLKEVTRSLNNQGWHIAGAECLAEASVKAVHKVPVPPDIVSGLV